MANVKVAVRVRPLSKREEENDAVSVVNVHNETLLSITNWKIGGSDEGDRHRERVKYFSFDYVFNSSDKWDENYASQEKVYQQLGPEVISAACDGYNTCLFAYGQTSSGKTHTMVGTQMDCGLIPRISEGLFKSVTQLNEDVTYKFEISFLEIYNEKVRDLLAPLGNTKFTLKVREHAKDGPYVPDLSRHIVSDHQQVIELLEQGMISRTTASTHMHEFSSRSHAIFTIHFVQAKMEQHLPSEIVSKINLVDLAGSERANLNFSKDRLQEGANINKSLVMLGNCISALAENALSAISMESLANDDTDLRLSQGFGSKSPGFVPYRNSVLTWLLKDSLGGNAKTIMIATISPASIHYNETMSTLRYARRATHIVNQPIINEDPHVRLIRELRGEIHRLKNLLCSASLGSSSASLCQDYSINQMLQENEVRVDQLTEAWVDKWKDVALIMQECNVGIRRQSVGVVVESDLPHLIGLDDDLSTGIVLYHLQNGCTRIGRGDALTTQDIVLNSTVDVESEHAVITIEDDIVTFYPLGDAACTINGVDVKEPVQLKQGAVILLGKTNMFRFNHPAQAAQMREKRAQALAAASQGGTSPVGSSSDGTWSPDDTEAVMEQMSLLLSPRSPHDLKEGHFFDSNEFDSYGEEEVIDSEQCIMGDNQQELVERQRLVVCGLKKEHALAMVKAEEELEEMQRKVEEEKDKGALKLQQEIENYHQHKQTVSSSNGIADKSSFPKFVDLESIQVKQAHVECKHLMQRELILRHAERKAVANLGRKRAAIDVQRMSAELEIEEEENRLQEMEMLICYTPPSERMSSASSDSSSNGMEEKNKNSKGKVRSEQSAKTISNGKLKDAPSNTENSRMTLSTKHKRSSSLSQKENTNKVLPDRTRSRSASVSSAKSSGGRAGEGKTRSNGNSKSRSDVFSRLYPQNRPKFDYLKKKDTIQYDDVAAKRSSQWERGKLMRREVSPLKGEIPPGKSNIEKQKLKHSYQPKSFENGLSVPPKSSRNGPPRKSGLSSSMPRTKSQSNPGLSRTMPGPKTKMDLNSKRKGSIPTKGNVEKKPFKTSSTSSLPDVSCTDVGKSRLRVKRQSTPDLPKKILKKGEKKAAVWQDVKGSPQRLKPELTRMRSSSDVSTLSSTSSFPKETTGRRRCSTDLWTSVDLLPIRKSSSQAYFLPWNSERCVSLENLFSDTMPQSMACKQRSSSMVDLPRNVRENGEVPPVDEGEVEREGSDPEIAVIKASEPNKGVRVGEGLPTFELSDGCTQDNDDEDKGETCSTTSSSDISEEDSLEEDFGDKDDFNEKASLVKTNESAKKEEVKGGIILENDAKSLPVEQSIDSFPEDTEQLSSSDPLDRQNDGTLKGKHVDDNLDGNMTPTQNILDDGRMVDSQNEGAFAVVKNTDPDKAQTGLSSETDLVITVEEHETDSSESSNDDLSSCDESIASDATYSLPASESRFHKEMKGKDLSNADNTPFITLNEGIPNAKEGNPALDEDERIENGEPETVDDDSDSAIGHCGVERNNILREAGCQTCPVDGVVFQEKNAQYSSSDDSSSFSDSISPDAVSTPPKLGLPIKENDFERLVGNCRIAVVLSEPSNEEQKSFSEAGCQTTPVEGEFRQDEDDFGDSRSKDALSSPEESSPPSACTDLQLVPLPDKSETEVGEDEKLGDGRRILTETSCQTYPQDGFGLNGMDDAQYPSDEPSSVDDIKLYGKATKPGMWECDKATAESISDYAGDEMSSVPTLRGMVKTVNEVACQTYPLYGVELNGMDEPGPSDVKGILFPKDWQSCNPDTKEGIGNDVMIYHENVKLPTLREMSCQTLPIGSIHLNGLGGTEPLKDVKQEPCDSNGVCLEKDKNMVEPVLVTSLNGLPSVSVASSSSSTDEEEEGNMEEDKLLEKERVNNGIDQSDNDRTASPEVAIVPKDTTINGDDFKTGIETNKDTDGFSGDKGMAGDMVETPPRRLQAFLTGHDTISKDGLSPSDRLVPQSDEDGDTSPASPCSSSDLPSSLSDHFPSDDNDQDPCLSPTPQETAGAIPELYLTNTPTSPKDEEKGKHLEEDDDTLQGGVSCLVEKSESIVPSEGNSKEPDCHLKGEEGKEGNGLSFKMDGSDEDLDATPNDSSSSGSDMDMLHSILDSSDDKEGEGEEMEEVITKLQGKAQPDEISEKPEGDEESSTSEDSLHSLTYSPEEEVDGCGKICQHQEEMLNLLSSNSVPHVDGNTEPGPGELELQSVHTQEDDRGFECLVRSHTEDTIEGIRKRGKVVTFCSPLVTVCDDVGSQSETLSEVDEIEKNDSGDEESQDDNRVEVGSGNCNYLQDNSEDFPFLENTGDNSGEAMVDGWESSVLGMEKEDWEIFDNLERKDENQETDVAADITTDFGDEDSSQMKYSGNVSEEECARDLSLEIPDKCGESFPASAGLNIYLDFEMRDGGSEATKGIIEGTVEKIQGIIEDVAEESQGTIEDATGDISTNGVIQINGENDNGSAEFKKGTVCQTCQRRCKVGVDVLGSAETDTGDWCSQCGCKDGEQEKLDSGVNSPEARGVEQPSGALQQVDESKQNCIGNPGDISTSSLPERVMISDPDSICTVELEKDCEPPSRLRDLPAGFVSHHPAVHGYPESSTRSQGSGVIDAEPEHCKGTAIVSADIAVDECDGITPVEDRSLDGEALVMEFGNDDNLVRNSLVDSDVGRNKGEDALLKDASLSDYDETDDEAESSIESDEIDVDLFKKNVMQVGVVFNQGKRYIIDGDEIFDPFALSPIKEEKDGSDLPSSLVAAVEDFQLPLSEEEGDVALYQRGKMEMEDVIMEPGFYSDESDDDGMYHDNELPDEDVMDSGEGQWCPPRVEVALIKDVFTAEQDLPSDLIKSPDVENFLLQQEDCSDQDVTFGELAPHHSLSFCGVGGAYGSDAINLSSPELSKKKTNFLMSLNVNTSPSSTATTDGHFGISPVAQYRKSQKVSFSPQQAQFSVASPCSSPESPQRKFVRGNSVRDSGSDTDVSEGETTANVRGAGDGRQRRNKLSEHFAKDIRKDLVRSSCAKLSKFMQVEENKEVTVGQVYSVEEETQTESGVYVEGMVQSYMHDSQDCRESSEEEGELDQDRRWAQQKAKKDHHKEAAYPSDITADVSISKNLPSQQKTEQTKPVVATYTQTSPMVSPGGATIPSGKGNIQRPSTLHLTPKGKSPSKHNVNGGKKPLNTHSPSSGFRWDLFPSATTFQPPNLRRSQSLPTKFDNPLLVSPRKSSAETPSSDGGGGYLGLSLSSQEEGSGDDESSDPFSHLMKSLEHRCQLSINTSSRVRDLCDALRRNSLLEVESSSSPVMESEVSGMVFVSDEEESKMGSEPKSTQVIQAGRAKDESSNQLNSWWSQSASSNLCANCQNSIQHSVGLGNEGYILRGSGDVPELPLVSDEDLHQQQWLLSDERINLMSPVWEPVHKEAVSISSQEDFVRRVSTLVDKPQKEQNHNQVSLQERKNVTQPLINVTSSSPSRNWGDLRDFANKLSISQSRVRPVSQDVEELVPQRVQMPAFSDVSFDSEFAEHEFFSDEEGDSRVDLRSKEGEVVVKEEYGGAVEEDGRLAGEDGERIVEKNGEGIAEEDDDIDPDLWDDVIEPELTALMSNSTNTPDNQASEHATSSQNQAKATSHPQNSKSDIGRSETLGGLGNFATDIPAHRIKDHSNDYVLSVNINIPPFPHRVEQRWNPPSYDANLQCKWSDAPEIGNASNVSRGSEVLDKKGQDDVWMSHLRGTRAHAVQEGIGNGSKRLPSDSTESQLTASSGVFTSSIQTSEVVSSPTKFNESPSPTDSVLAEDEDMINVQNELQDFLAKNVTGEEMPPSFYDGYERVQTSTPEEVGTQVGSRELDKSWTSPELDALRNERDTVRRLSNSWDRSDLAVELMEARIMHGIGETDAFLRFLDNDVPLEEWLRTRNDLEIKHDEEKREILALEKSNPVKTGYSGKIVKPSSVCCNGWSPKRRKPPSEHLKFLQGLRKDLVTNAPPSFVDTKNEIEALLQEYKELHKNSESEIAQAQKELDGVRGASRIPSAAEKGLQMDEGGSKESGSDEDLIDKEIQSLHAASIAMSLSDSPGSDASSHRRFSFSGISSDDDRISDDAIRGRRKYSRLNGDLSEPLKLVKAPSRKSLKEKLEDAERQVSSERQLWRGEEQCRQSLMQSSGEWSESECSVLIGQTFQILLQETASFQGVQQHSVEERWENGGWRVLYEMQGIFIFEKCVMSASPSSPKRYLGLEFIKAPASCVFNHLRKPINLQGLFGKCLKKLSVLQRLKREKFILHLTFNTRQCGLHYPRAVTCIFHAEQRKNLFVVGAPSVKQLNVQPQKTVPATVLLFGFCLEPFYSNGMEHCRVTVMSQIDMKDCLEADMLQTLSQKLLSRVLGNLKGLVEVGQL